MTIIERLKVEHGVFLLQLRYLEELARRPAPRAVLGAVAETIATAEAHHSTIEERVLYPVLAKALGKDFPLLVAVREEHKQIRELVARIRSEALDEALVLQFVETLRAHLESEIHSMFRLAEESISTDELVSMCSWDVEHVYEAAGQRDLWVKKLPTDP